MSQLSVVVLHANLKALSCRRSNLQLSDAVQKCHTRWQQVRCGMIADLYKSNLAFTRIRFLSLPNIPIILPTSLHTLRTWFLKFRFSSRFTPRILMDYDCSTFLPHIFRSTFLSPFGFPKITAWYLSQLTFKRLSWYHLVILSPLSTSIFSTLFVVSFATKTWWSSAYIETFASDIMLGISFRKIFQISGPKVLPCGHPLSSQPSHLLQNLSLLYSLFPENMIVWAVWLYPRNCRPAVYLWATEG